MFRLIVARVRALFLLYFFSVNVFGYLGGHPEIQLTGKGRVRIIGVQFMGGDGVQVEDESGNAAVIHMGENKKSSFKFISGEALRVICNGVDIILDYPFRESVELIFVNDSCFSSEKQGRIYKIKIGRQIFFYKNKKGREDKIEDISSINVQIEPDGGLKSDNDCVSSEGDGFYNECKDDGRKKGGFYGGGGLPIEDLAQVGFRIERSNDYWIEEFNDLQKSRYFDRVAQHSAPRSVNVYIQFKKIHATGKDKSELSELSELITRVLGFATTNDELVELLNKHLNKKKQEKLKKILKTNVIVDANEIYRIIKNGGCSEALLKELEGFIQTKIASVIENKKANGAGVEHIPIKGGSAKAELAKSINNAILFCETEEDVVNLILLLESGIMGCNEGKELAVTLISNEFDEASSSIKSSIRDDFKGAENKILNQKIFYRINGMNRKHKDEITKNLKKFIQAKSEDQGGGDRLESESSGMAYGYTVYSSDEDSAIVTIRPDRREKIDKFAIELLEGTVSKPDRIKVLRDFFSKCDDPIAKDGELFSSLVEDGKGVFSVEGISELLRKKDYKIFRRAIKETFEEETVRKKLLTSLDEWKR